MNTKNNHSLPQRLTIYGALLLLLAMGCGGGGSGAGPGIDQNPTSGGSTGGETRAGTALFNVDVSSGKVNVTNLTPLDRSAFAGGAVSFANSTLIDTPGNTGRRVMRVAMKNNLNETIGSDSGLRLTFGDFTNMVAGEDLRAKTTLSTFAGSGTIGLLNGPASSARFDNPRGIAIHPNGNVYVADYNSNVIRLIRNGQVSTFAGSGMDDHQDGAGQAAAFSTPNSLALDSAGNLFVGDGSTIRRITPEGVVTTVAGSSNGSVDGPGNTATFTQVAGIAVGPDGTIYVCESGANKVRKISPPIGDPRQSSSYYVSTLAGSNYSGFVDGIGTAARLNAPYGIALDANALYVIDVFNYAIRRIAFSGEVSTVAGTGTYGNLDGNGNEAKFLAPLSIVSTGPDALVVSDYYSMRQVVLSPGTSPTVATNWKVTRIAGSPTEAGDVQGPGTIARFVQPSLLAFDGSSVFFATINQKIFTMSASTGFPIPINGGTSTSEKVAMANSDGNVAGSLNPYLDYPSNLEAGEASEDMDWAFTVPEGVTAFQFTVTVEGSTATPAGLAGIKRLTGGPGSADNLVTTVAGSGTEGSGYVNGPAAAARFNMPRGIAVDAQGNGYVLDRNNNAIRRIGTDGQVTTVAGVLGNFGVPTDGLGTVARFTQPNGIAVNSAGTVIYVADNMNRIRRLALTGSEPSQPGSWTVATIAGTGTGGFADGVGTAAQFSGAWALALGSNDILYVSEVNGLRIRRLDPIGSDLMNPSSWQVSLVAGSTSGSSGFVNGQGSAARFEWPGGLALDASGNLYVTDMNRVRKVTPGGKVTTFSGSGILGSSDGSATTAKFTNLGPVATDSAGYVYVRGGDYRVRRISPEGLVTTVAGTYTEGYLDGPGSTAKFGLIGTTMCFDSQGSLWSTSDHTIRKIQRIITK